MQVAIPMAANRAFSLAIVVHERLLLNTDSVEVNLDNLDYILKNIPTIKEVSIGHALVCDAIDLGLKETVNKYKQITIK